jgi:hypothetical protein
LYLKQLFYSDPFSKSLSIGLNYDRCLKLNKVQKKNIRLKRWEKFINVINIVYSSEGQLSFKDRPVAVKVGKCDARIAFTSRKHYKYHCIYFIQFSYSLIISYCFNYFNKSLCLRSFLFLFYFIYIRSEISLGNMNREIRTRLLK